VDSIQNLKSAFKWDKLGALSSAVQDVLHARNLYQELQANGTNT